MYIFLRVFFVADVLQLITFVSCAGSDGQLFSLDLPIHDSEQIPGRLLTTLTTISPRYQAAILPLSSTHLAIYGADASEEGTFQHQIQ